MPPNNERTLTVAEAIREATDQAMSLDGRVLVIGEGVPDPKGIFGTTLGLRERYGDRRVFDMPVSENGVTGICIGVALQGMRPIMTHQRVDFSLYALEQLINNAAKWGFMFGTDQGVPLVIRMVIGRGWGQGAQHSQNLSAVFAHIPGLVVVTPTLPLDTKGLLLASIASDQPVIFLEHRWIYGLSGPVPAAPYETLLGRALVRRVGADVTVVANSYMTVEALRAADVLAAVGVSVEVVDLLTLSPLDRATTIASAQKTGHLLVADLGWGSFGVAAEVMASVAEAGVALKTPPTRVTLPDMPVSSAPSLAERYYPTSSTLARQILLMLGQQALVLPDVEETVSHDVPDHSFTGPF